MEVTIELTNNEVIKLQQLSGILVRDSEDAEDALHIIIGKDD